MENVETNHQKVSCRIQVSHVHLRGGVASREDKSRLMCCTERVIVCGPPCASHKGNN